MKKKSMFICTSRKPLLIRCLLHLLQIWTSVNTNHIHQFNVMFLSWEDDSKLCMIYILKINYRLLQTSICQVCRHQTLHQCFLALSLFNLYAFQQCLGSHLAPITRLVYSCFSPGSDLIQRRDKPGLTWMEVRSWSSLVWVESFENVVLTRDWILPQWSLRGAAAQRWSSEQLHKN